MNIRVRRVYLGEGVKENQRDSLQDGRQGCCVRAGWGRAAICGGAHEKAGDPHCHPSSSLTFDPCLIHASSSSIALAFLRSCFFSRSRRKDFFSSHTLRIQKRRGDGNNQLTVGELLTRRQQCVPPPSSQHTTWRRFKNTVIQGSPIVTLVGIRGPPVNLKNPSSHVIQKVSAGG